MRLDNYMFVGLNGGIATSSNGYTHNKQTTDLAGVKFISLASALNSGTEQKVNGFADPRFDDSRSTGKMIAPKLKTIAIAERDSLVFIENR